MKRAWWIGVSLVLVLGCVACADESDPGGNGNNGANNGNNGANNGNNGVNNGNNGVNNGNNGVNNGLNNGVNNGNNGVNNGNNGNNGVNNGNNGVNNGNNGVNNGNNGVNNGNNGVNNGNNGVDPRPEGCRRHTDCDEQRGEFCQRPDAGPLCGNCFEIESTCVVDEECAEGDVCIYSTEPCQCSPATICAPACTGDADCDTAEKCYEDGHCAAIMCEDDSVCPAWHTCQNATCSRTPCGDDTDCGDTGACVLQRCYEVGGVCIIPPP